MLPEQKESQAILSDVTKEMAIPQMAQSVLRALAKQKRRLNQSMTATKANAYATLSDLGGVVTRIEKFSARGNIYSQGDSARTIMYIQRGRVEFSVAASKTDKQAIVAILGPGNFFGEACLAGHSTRAKTATAMISTVLQVIERNEMIRALRADPALAHRFLCYMLSRNVRTEENLIDQLSQNSEKRLARALLRLAGERNHSKRRRFAGISHETLARMIGTTRARVSFFMNKFRKRGLIGYHGPLDRNGGMHINTSLLRGEVFSK
ncbi:MAG: Crp/Fnr family transcriptional regulator [Terriglobales bacterium]